MKYTYVGIGDVNLNKLSKEDLERIRKGETTVEDWIVSGFSFQKPDVIIKNFRKLDNHLKISDVFNKPDEGMNPRESIEKAVGLRNQIVHEGFTDIELTHEDAMKLFDTIETAADRLYEEFARVYGFDTNYSFR